MARAIVLALKQADTGTVVAEVRRKMGISEATARAARAGQFKSVQKRGLAQSLMNDYRISQRRACAVLLLRRSTAPAARLVL